MAEVLRERGEMLANLDPVLRPESYVFCLAPSLVDAPRFLASFQEDEGLSLLIRTEDAIAYGYPVQDEMRQITLQVHSALDGVGLTAAVSNALAAHGIPCNMIAAYRHDHIFIPIALAERALAVLLNLQEQARAAQKKL